VDRGRNHCAARGARRRAPPRLRSAQSRYSLSDAAAQIISACDSAGVSVAQLHGDASRLSLLDLPERLRCIYVMTAGADGSLVTAAPGELQLEASVNAVSGAQGWRKAVDWVSRGRRTVDWLLVDGCQPGSGQAACDWRTVRVPRGASRRGWLLAGGLTPDNVAQALAQASPQGVDVASGVAGPDGVAKDPIKVEAFIHAVRMHAALAV